MKNVEFNQEFLEKLNLTSDKEYTDLYTAIVDQLNSESLKQNQENLGLPNISQYNDVKSISYADKVTELKNILLKACSEGQTVKVNRTGDDIGIKVAKAKSKDLEQ